MIGKLFFSEIGKERESKREGWKGREGMVSIGWNDAVREMEVEMEGGSTRKP